MRARRLARHYVALLWREALALTRNPADAAGRMATFSYVALLNGLIFYGMSDRASSLAQRIGVGRGRGLGAAGAGAAFRLEAAGDGGACPCLLGSCFGCRCSGCRRGVRPVTAIPASQQKANPMPKHKPQTEPRPAQNADLLRAPGVLPFDPLCIHGERGASRGELQGRGRFLPKALQGGGRSMKQHPASAAPGHACRPRTCGEHHAHLSFKPPPQPARGGPQGLFWADKAFFLADAAARLYHPAAFFAAKVASDCGPWQGRGRRRGCSALSWLDSLHSLETAAGELFEPAGPRRGMQTGSTPTRPHPNQTRRRTKRPPSAGRHGR